MYDQDLTFGQLYVLNYGARTSRKVNMTKYITEILLDKCTVTNVSIPMFKIPNYRWHAVIVLLSVCVHTAHIIIMTTLTN